LLASVDRRPTTDRLAKAEAPTALGDPMLTGHATLDGAPFQLAVMDFAFMGGSMGRVVGEKFTRACEAAAEHNIPLVSVTASGGARMQEGILSLMQLPKTVCAVEDLHDSGGAMISIMAHPTTAGCGRAPTARPAESAPQPAAPPRRAPFRRARAPAAAARPHRRRAERRADLALGRARAASGPAVHAGLRRTNAGGLRRAARRPRSRRRRGARHRPRPL